MTDFAVAVADLRLKRGSFTLRVDDWVAPKGAVVGVVGHNGAGKSTLLEALYGMRPRYVGRMDVLGKDPATHVASLRQNVGYMADDMPVLNGQIARVLYQMSGYYEHWSQPLVKDLMRVFRLNAGKRTQDLSKGEATKLRLVMALAHRPKLLILDEPATGLDVRARRALLEIVMDIARDPGNTVIISTHTLPDLDRVCDHVLVIEHGEVLHQGPVDEVLPSGHTLEEAMVHWGLA